MSRSREQYWLELGARVASRKWDRWPWFGCYFDKGAFDRLGGFPMPNGAPATDAWRLKMARRSYPSVEDESAPCDAFDLGNGLRDGWDIRPDLRDACVLGYYTRRLEQECLDAGEALVIGNRWEAEGLVWFAKSDAFGMEPIRAYNKAEVVVLGLERLGVAL